MADKIVFSTDKGRIKEEKKSDKAYIKAEGPTKMRLEKNSRGGKLVTVLFNLPFEKSEAKKWMKDLQAVCACGGTMKNSTIELRGDVREKVVSFFEKKGEKIVKAGG